MSDDDKANQESKESQEDRAQAPVSDLDDTSIEETAAETEAPGAADAQSLDTSAGAGGEVSPKHELANDAVEQAEVTVGDGEAVGLSQPDSKQGGVEAAQGSSQEAQMGIGLV